MAVTTRKTTRKPGRKPAVKKIDERLPETKVTETNVIQEEKDEVEQGDGSVIVNPPEQDELKRKIATLKERMKTNEIGPRRNLYIPPERLDPNYYHRWVRDRDLKLQTYLDEGFEFYDAGRAGDGNLESSGLGSRSTAPSKDSGDKLHLMRIPKEIHDLYQKAKQERIDQIENDLKPATERALEGQALPENKLEIRRQ